jgi:hypothetical protein
MVIGAGPFMPFFLAIAPCVSLADPAEGAVMSSDHVEDLACSELHQAIVAAFTSVLHNSRLPPMTVMDFSASAGPRSKEVAEQHGRVPLYPRGWQPDSAADIEALYSGTSGSHEDDPSR